MTAKIPRLADRTSGVLLHVTSLPGAACCGDLGQGARDFADFLAAAGQSWWQMLPLNPIDEYHSPYASLSAFAGEPLLLDLNRWVDEGLLEPEDCGYAPKGPEQTIAYEAARDFRKIRWRKAFDRFRKKVAEEQHADVARFLDENRNWLDDHALFCALVEKFGTIGWTAWPAELRDREPKALEAARRELADTIAYHVFLQYEFDRQWTMLRDYCHERGVGLVGDIPIYVSPASVDVWANRDLFILDDIGRPTYVAGVPGDAFNPDGQRWDAPLYRWDIMAQDGYNWWMRRLEILFRRYDAVRLDHFIGFHNYYQLPADPESTIGQGWFPGPGEDFFRAVYKDFPNAQLVAEDLGALSEGVKALRDKVGLPGLNVIQFAFCDLTMDDAPTEGHWRENSVVCTGTHDTNTVRGWFEEEIIPLAKGEIETNIEYDLVVDTLWPGSVERTPAVSDNETEATAATTSEPGLEPTSANPAVACADIQCAMEKKPVHWAAIEAIMRSPAHTAIVPMQDLLGLGSGARFNRPGIPNGNWQWRLRADELSNELIAQLREVTDAAERSAEA